MTTAPDTLAPAPKPATKAGTLYIVFTVSSESGGKRWAEMARVNATSAQAAISQAVKEAGTYVATPARSWKPVTVKVETTTHFRLQDA